MIPTILLIGLAAATVATIVRALVPMLWLLVKPFSCDLCMSWWSSICVGAVWSVNHPATFPDTLVLLLAATAVSMTVLKIHNRLTDIGTPPSE